MKAQEIFKKVNTLNKLNEELGIGKKYYVEFSSDREYGLKFESYREFKKYMKEEFELSVNELLDADYNVNDRTEVNTNEYGFEYKNRIDFYIVEE